jgi:hypothetical protein
MAYLRIKDYYAYIQADNLQQVIRADDSLRLQAERGAEAKINEYLVQKYDLKKEFKDLSKYSKSVVRAGELVDLNYSEYNPLLTYSIDSFVSVLGKSYICITAITVPEPFNVLKWLFIGNQYDLYNVPYPYPLFQYENFYNVGDKVFYDNKVYKCKVASVVPSQNSVLQNGTQSNKVSINVFPDSKLNGVTYWGLGIPYLFSNLPVNSKPTNFSNYSNNTTYLIGNRVNFNSTIYECIKNSLSISPDSDISRWQPVSWLSGDNRNLSLVECYIDIVLYKLHKGIAPRNIPDLRVKAYDDAITWLDKCADGRITLDVQKLQPSQGNKIRFGGNSKRINNY